MTQAPAERTRHLETAEAAEFLINPNSSRHLEPFLRGECGLAEAAKALGISKSGMGYWLNKLLGLGVIEEVRVEKRGRHYVPIYRATAEVFTVPLENVAVESNEEILEIHARGFAEAERAAVIRQARRQAEEWYLEYRLWNGAGQRNFRPKDGPARSPFVLSFGTIRLSDEVAEAAKRELTAFIHRYGALADPKGKAYLFKLLIVEAPG